MRKALHMNAVAFNEKDDQILLLGRNIKNGEELDLSLNLSSIDQTEGFVLTPEKKKVSSDGVGDGVAGRGRGTIEMEGRTGTSKRRVHEMPRENGLGEHQF